MLNPDDSYLVYTDGSCYTGDRIGSWAWVAIDGDDNEVMGGGVNRDTTISRMELLGPIDALETIYDDCGPSTILVYSDSEYVVLGITNRRRQRKKNNDLWDWLDEVVDAHEHVEFEHVRGHSGDYYNELVDREAHRLRKEAQCNAIS